MEKIIIGFIIVVAIIFLIKVLKNGKNKLHQYKYTRKDFFMSRAEHECYDALINAVGDKYYIFSQVHLHSIIDHKVVGQNWRRAFGHINQKSVDFVLCDKEYISPKLVIELDDQTHKRQDRKDRDKIVEEILTDVGLPLLRLQNHGDFNSNDLLEKINIILNNSE